MLIMGYEILFIRLKKKKNEWKDYGWEVLVG